MCSTAQNSVCLSLGYQKGYGILIPNTWTHWVLRTEQWDCLLSIETGREPEPWLHRGRLAVDHGRGGIPVRMGDYLSTSCSRAMLQH